MKEFNIALGKSRNKFQFVQLCLETERELNSGVGYIKSVKVFDDYYNLNFDLLQLVRLAKFIKTGEYKKQLELYV